MKFILIVLWTAQTATTNVSFSKNWNEVAMQEFNSLKTCEAAAKVINDLIWQGEKPRMQCVSKGVE